MPYPIIAACMFMVIPMAMAETPGLEVTHAYVRASLPGQTAVSAFATFKNLSEKPLVLESIHSKSAKTVELHSHNSVNGQMQMRKIENFSIPAKGEAVFKPGDQHIMLLGVEKPLLENTTVTLEICFDELCSVIEMPVISVLNEKATKKTSAAASHHPH